MNLRANGLHQCPQCQRILICNTFNFPFLLIRAQIRGRWKTLEDEDATCWDCANGDPRNGRRIKRVLKERAKKKELVEALEEINL